MKPVLAQQSIRELERTNRTPDDVMDAAVWAVFQEGYRDGFGADADHLKTTDDIDYMIASGFTMFTFDPGDYVVNEADSLSTAELEDRVTQLPWEELEDTLDGCLSRYKGKAIEISDEFTLRPTREDVLRALTKYGNVIVHASKMQNHLVKNYPNFPAELELSVDETESVTSPFEHYLVVKELKRLGTDLVSIAPRFVGGFEKGIDYKGDLELFRREYIKHLQIADVLGPYKISIHSGSDKFSVYNVIGLLQSGHVHVKTAGTSYLEALRTVATTDPDLFREILDYSRELYEREKKTYHVSAEIENVPPGKRCSDEQLMDLFEHDDARQVLHVAFGRILTDTDNSGNFVFKDSLLKVLKENESTHYDYLKAHFRRHLDPFQVPA